MHEQPPSGEWFSIAKILGYAAFASFGGILGYLIRSYDEDRAVVFKRAFVEGLSAGFVGVIVLLLCTTADLSDEWTGVIVGVCGWLGARATIQFLEKIVFKRLGILPDEDKGNDNHRPSGSSD